MAKSTSIYEAPGFNFSGGVLTIQHGGNVELNEAANGSWSYHLGVNEFTLSAAQVNAINTIEIGRSTNLSLNVAAVNNDNLHITGAGDFNISGVGFTNASGATPFETTAHIDTLVVANTGAHTVDGDAGRYFAVLWDTLDDAYGQLAGQGFANNLFGYGNGYTDLSHLNTPVLGETTAGAAASHIIGGFVQLGIDYVNYLTAGGDALDYLTAKASTAGRDQTVHDNILGNVTTANLLERQFVLAGDIAAKVPGDWETRPYYDGSLADVADKLASISFDVAHSVERDYAFG